MMASFDQEERRIQAAADQARERARDEMWQKQMYPKFKQGGLAAEQIDAARRMFLAAFDAGWESHQAFLMGEFIRENQKQKVHLA